MKFYIIFFLKYLNKKQKKRQKTLSVNFLLKNIRFNSQNNKN